MGSTINRFHFGVAYDGITFDRTAVSAFHGVGIGRICISGRLLLRVGVLYDWKSSFSRWLKYVLFLPQIIMIWRSSKTRESFGAID